MDKKDWMRFNLRLLFDLEGFFLEKSSVSDL